MQADDAVGINITQIVPDSCQELFDKMDLCREVAWNSLSDRRKKAELFEIAVDDYSEIFKLLLDPHNDTKHYFDIACQAAYRLDRICNDPIKINDKSCQIYMTAEEARDKLKRCGVVEVKEFVEAGELKEKHLVILSKNKMLKQLCRLKSISGAISKPN